MNNPLVLVIGTTETATINGISAAGADPSVMKHTPAADAEIVEYGTSVFAPVLPKSPTGCPTPAIVSRAVRDILGFPVRTVTAGLTHPTAVPRISLEANPGKDIREEVAVPATQTIYSNAKTVGSLLSADSIYLGESIPGGTTTAMGVLTALGEPNAVSSSLPNNPQNLKQTVIAEGLQASEIRPGGLYGRPLDAITFMGDPVQAALMGIAEGALEAGISVILSGGTQMLAIAALLRHGGIDRPLTIATTSFIQQDDSANLKNPCKDLDVELIVTDPEFDSANHIAFNRFCAGEAKEGVGMGGVLAMANETNIPMETVRDRIRDCYDEIFDNGS